MEERKIAHSERRPSGRAPAGPRKAARHEEINNNDERKAVSFHRLHDGTRGASGDKVEKEELRKERSAIK